MRWVHLALLLAVVTILVMFVVENNENATVNLFNKSLTAPLSWFFIAVFFLGMWGGGTVVGFVKWTYRHATEHGEPKRTQPTG
jgi:uncharacterized integral membrane protein